LSIEKWNARYRAGEQLFETPAPLVERFVAELTPGVALDLACGPGRNAVYLAQRGWRVTAVDGSPIAIAKLRERNGEIDARVADLERVDFQIQPDSFDLICDCYYLQPDLFPRMKMGIRAGGMAIVIVHLTPASPVELRGCFADWKILHYREGQPGEACHQRSVAELVAMKE
jgi:tellurite methyltransferase